MEIPCINKKLSYRIVNSSHPSCPNPRPLPPPPPPPPSSSRLCKHGAFSIYKNFWKISIGNFRLGERIPFATSSIRGTPGRLKDRERSGTGDKNNKEEKSVNGAQIFHWEVSTGKTGLPFEQFHFFWEFSSRAN